MMNKTRTPGVVTIKHFRFLLLMIGFCSISFLRVSLILNIPVFVYLVFSAFLCALSSPEEIVSFMCSLVCFSGSFQYRFALLIGIVFLITKKGIKRINIRNVLPLLLLMVWELLHAGQSNLNAYGFFQEFSELIALTVLLMYSSLDYSDDLPIRTFVYSTLFSCFINLFASISLLGFSFGTLTRLGKVGIDIADFQSLIDPNTMGLICLMAIIGLLLTVYKTNVKKSDSFVIVVLLAFMLLSQSKAALVGLIVVFFLYFFLSEKKRMISLNKFILGVVIAAIVSILATTAFKGVIEAVIDRFSLSDVTTGREVIFKFYSMHLLQNPKNILFGIGLHDYTSQIADIYGGLWAAYPGLASYRNDLIVYKPCHNNIQEIIVVWGIVGLALVFMLFKKMISHSPVRKEKINYIPLTLLLIYGLQGELISSGGALMILMFSFICMEYNRNSSVAN